VRPRRKEMAKTEEELEVIEEDFESQEGDDEPKDTEGVEKVSEVEQIALDLGWRPEDQYRGDKQEWVDARTFILNSRAIQDNMRGENKSLKKKVDQLIEGFQELKRHSEKLREADIKKLRGELKTQKRVAVVEGDLERVEAIEKEMDEIEDVKGKPNSNISDEDNELLQAWYTANPWYGTNKEMAKYADSRVENYSGAPLDRMLKKIRKDVVDMFEDEFEEDAPHEKQAQTNIMTPNPKSRAATVESGEVRPETSGRKKFTVKDLTQEQRDFCRTFVKAGAVKSTQDYIDQLAAIGELR